MKTCPSCSKATVKVIRSREIADGRRRLHHCLSCGHRWTSLEVVEGRLTADEARASLALQGLIESLEKALSAVKALHARA